MRRLLSAGVAGLVLTGAGAAQTPPAGAAGRPPAPATLPTVVAPAPAATPTTIPVGAALGYTTPAAVDPSRFWFGTEALGWWIQGQSVPALITTSPAGTAVGSTGVLGAGGTTVLAGDTRYGDDIRFGGRFNLGMWLDDDRQWGVGGEFFILSQSGDRFSAASLGAPILARPFTRFPAGTPDAQLIAFPGLAAGSGGVEASTNLLGAGAYALRTIAAGCDYWIGARAGYRYLRLTDEVGITEQVTATGDVPGRLTPGTTFTISDAFRTTNQFHGGDIGLAGRAYRDRVFVQANARLGIGANVRDLTAQGSTLIALPGQTAVGLPGGLLVPGGGRSYSDTHFALVPELGLNLGYQLSERLDIFVGYNVLWWTNVIRAGDQVDLRVNPALLAPPVGGPAIPPAAVSDTTIWVQGISFGLLGRF